MTQLESRNHLIVISVDALNAKDLAFIKTLPHFNSFITDGAYIEEVQSVYPSLTYTCHTSIISGTYPEKHGIYANEIVDTHNPTNQPWNWYEEYIKVPTLFDYAKKASLKTANVLWPVMASAPIDYNIPEIWSVTGKSFLSLFLKNGTKSLLPLIAKHIGKIKEKEQPYLDNFIEAMATDIILKKKPNLLTVHLIELDHMRHVAGLKDPISKDILQRMDQRIGRIIEATKAAGTYDHTTFVVLGDHGCTDFQNIIFLNSFFVENGLIQVDEQNNITTWKVYANACGGSAHIHVNKDLSKNDLQKIDDVLGKLRVMPDTFIKYQYSKQEAKELFHLDGDFTYVLEAKDGYVFKNNITDKLIKHRAAVRNAFQAEHGQLPTHPDLKTLFLAKGPMIKKGTRVETAHLVDEGPTLAKMLGLKMENISGKVLEEIFE
jgi:predicted AlkP superfamily pyrophosphatase or phosphodiesterase